MLAVTESQEAQGLVDEIQQQPSVFVLRGPAIVITNVATASALPADGWSTESVSRVVRTARTKHENNGKERAEHAYDSYIQDEMTTFDTLPATVQGLDEGANPTEKPEPEDDHDDETEQSLSDGKHEDKLQESMRTWGIHQTAHWYGCYVLVEPSADSFWQPPSTVVVLVKHRNVQLVQS